MLKLLNLTFLISKITAISFLIAALFVSACSSENEPIKITNLIEDPIEIKVSGIARQNVLDNVNAYISSLPMISKKRARLYDSEIKQSITKAVHAYGYYHPIIELEYPKFKDQNNFTVKAKVDLGKPLYIRNVQVDVVGEGNKYQSFLNIINNSNIKPYHLLSHGDYKKLKEDLYNRALELGFFDARFSVARILVYKEQNAADVSLILDTKKRYQFAAIEADDQSLELLKPSSSLVPFKEGDNFSSKTLNSFSNSLTKTRFYRSVDVHAQVDKRKDQKVPISLELQKNKNNLFRVGLGYSTDEQVRGILAWDKPLINEHGHSFSSFLRASNIKQDAQAIYKIPYKNPNLDYFYLKAAQIHTDFNDTLSDLSHLSFHYVANMIGATRRDYYLALEYEDYTQGLEEGYCTNLMPGVLLSRRTTTGGFDPKTGYSISFDNKFALRAISDYNFWRSEFLFSGIFSPTENTRVFYKLYQGAILGQDSLKAPPSMRFFAGGEKILRGFSYKSKSPTALGKLKGGRYLSAATLEYNFPLGISNSRGAIFLDSAICTDDYSTQRDLLLGPGIGYRFLSEYGILKVDIAYGIDNHNNSNQFKFHLSFGPEF